MSRSPRAWSLLWLVVVVEGLLLAIFSVPSLRPDLPPRVRQFFDTLDTALAQVATIAARLGLGSPAIFWALLAFCLVVCVGLAWRGARVGRGFPGRGLVLGWTGLVGNAWIQCMVASQGHDALPEGGVFLLSGLGLVGAVALWVMVLPIVRLLRFFCDRLHPGSWP